MDSQHTLWRHQMEIFSALLALCAGNSPVTGEFSAQRPVTRSFDVFFDLRLNKPLSKQSWGWWFETPSHPLWRHRNDRMTSNQWEKRVHLRWMPLDHTDDKSTLVQVMAWCRQATSHYPSQCWPRFMSPYGITRPQCVKKQKTNIFIFLKHGVTINQLVNTLRSWQNGCHVADDIFKCIQFIENHCVLIQISCKYPSNGLINNTLALVQIMAWRRTGDKPLSEPMMVRFPDTCMRHRASITCYNTPQELQIVSFKCFVLLCPPANHQWGLVVFSWGQFHKRYLYFI